MNDNDDDFGSAFAEGIKAAADADNAKERFRGLVERMSIEVARRTHGEIAISMDNTVIEKAASHSNGLFANVGLQPAPHRIAALGIFASTANGVFTNKHPKQRRRICTVVLGPGTYPLQIGWEDESRMCHNDDDARRTLASVIKDARVGREFSELLASHPNRAREAELFDEWLGNLHTLALQQHIPAIKIVASESLSDQTIRQVAKRLDSSGFVTLAADSQGVMTITLTDAGLEHMKSKAPNP